MAKNASSIPLSVTEWKTLRKNLEKYEGRIPHMYLDTRGKVTVGIGTLLNNMGAAQQLPFLHRNGGIASAAEKQKEYTTLRRLPYGKLYSAQSYRRHTSLVLTDHYINYQRDKHIKSFYSELKLIFPDFDTYPSEAKLALFDMIFNLGMTKLNDPRDWVLFRAAVHAKNWSAAANESNRIGVAASRNQYVKNLLLTAVKQTKTP